MKILFTLSLLLTVHFAQAQKTIQGTVVYQYTISGEGAEMMAAMMPEKMVVVYGDNAMMTSMEGGAMASMMGKIVVNKGKGYVIQDDKETIYNMSEEDMSNADTPQTNEVTKLGGKKKKIMGYTCEAYWVQTTQNGQEMTQIVWATKALKIPEIEGAGAANLNQGIGGAKGVDGFPMEVEIEMAAMPVKMVLSVTELKMEKPKASLFAKPQGYQQKPFSEMMNSMRN